MLYKTTTNFNGLKGFGSLCYASTLSTNRRNIYPRALKCVLISFKRRTNGHVMFNIQCREFFEFRNAVLYEHVFS